MLKYVSFKHAKNLIEEGDFLLFRSGGGFISWLINRAGETTYSHIGICSWHFSQDKTLGLLECVEFRELYGGRTISLERYVEQNDKRIDVYRPASPIKTLWLDNDSMKVVSKEAMYDGKLITNEMRQLTGLPYGYRRILWIASHKLPILRAFYDITSVMNDEESNGEVYPVCSSILAFCSTKLGYDFTKNRGDQWMEPSDFARSSYLNYILTLSVE
jgi:hypothetical protein